VLGVIAVSYQLSAFSFTRTCKSDRNGAANFTFLYMAGLIKAQVKPAAIKKLLLTAES
jgi:hypothetical protein